MQAFDKFVQIIARLRAPGGCPWDREQTHETLIPYCIEEAYEVVDAIKRGDMRELKEELGDLILQVVLHSQIANESKDFSIEDVLDEVSEKMIRRHPHVFSDSKIATADDVVVQWDEIKKKEGKKSVLDGVPKHAPQLYRSFKMGEKVSAVGFDWTDINGVLEKIQEEIQEIHSANHKAQKEEELGDLLFSMVQWSRHQNIDPEHALMKANEKFAKRFKAMEQMIEQDQKVLKKMFLTEWDAYWNKVKEMAL